MKIPKNKILLFKNNANLSAKEHQFIDQMAESNIPVSYWNLPFSKFEGSRDILDFVTDYTKNTPENYKAGSGAIFAGTYGIGKTYGLCSLLKNAIMNGYSAYYTTLPDLSIYATSKNTKDEYLNLCTKSDFLVIDEVDARHISLSDDARAFFGSLVEKIVRERTQNKLPVFFATNHDSLDPVFDGQQARAINSLLAPVTKTVIALGFDFREKSRIK